MFSKLNQLLLFKKKDVSKLKLIDYNEVRKVSDDDWNSVPHGQVKLTYFDRNMKHIATIAYNLVSGQIGLLFIHDPKLERRGLGTQMLEKAIDEIKNKNLINPHVKEIWAVTTNHNFFSNAFNCAFKPRKPAHHTVTGPGYYMEICKDCNKEI